MAWIGIELDFGSLFSYRMPNLSPSFALTSPVPSPSSFRLAIVDSAIRHTGSVDYGKEIFEFIKGVSLEIEPPDRVAVLKFFIKRLKPGKQGELLESTAVREYCHFDGPMKIYLSPPDRIDEICGLLKRLNHIGTSDSLAHCRAFVSKNVPPIDTICKEVIYMRPDISNMRRRPVVTVNDFDPKASFDQIDPYSNVRRGKPYQQKLLVLPLVEEKRGENYVIYRKEPFKI